MPCRTCSLGLFWRSVPTFTHRVMIAMPSRIRTSKTTARQQLQASLPFAPRSATTTHATFAWPRSTTRRVTVKASAQPKPRNAVCKVFAECQTPPGVGAHQGSTGFEGVLKGFFNLLEITLCRHRGGHVFRSTVAAFKDGINHAHFTKLV